MRSGECNHYLLPKGKREGGKREGETETEKQTEEESGVVVISLIQDHHMHVVPFQLCLPSL